jgi:Uroporphyrinogen decarboxylase (URO-D)
MQSRWMTTSPNADQKQSEQFDAWLAATTIPFENPEAEAAYKHRVTLIKDAVQLQKAPERIPVCPMVGHFPIEHAGISWYDAMYDYEKLANAWEIYHDHFSPDVFTGPRVVAPGRMLESLDFKLYRWAGNGLKPNVEYQFVEQEYMRGEEYQDLIDDPTGFFLNTYFPRIFGNLTAFENFPLLPPIHEIPLVPPAIVPFGTAAMKTALQTLTAAGDEANRWSAQMGRVSLKIMGRGLPAFSGGFSKAPFDVIGDSLRGTRGIMMDMFRHKDELIEACERLTPFMVKYGIAACKASGHLMPYLPLHKGADGFMSDAQFKTFYWPTLRKVAIGLIDAGLVPILFAEGGYNNRLEIIGDLPKGKAIWLFDRTDMKRAKATVGQTCCIAGNVPMGLLCTGTTDDVIAYCKDLIDTAGKNGGFILSTGAGIQGSKPENVTAMIDFSKKYGVYR